MFNGRFNVSRIMAWLRKSILLTIVRLLLIPIPENYTCLLKEILPKFVAAINASLRCTFSPGIHLKFVNSPLSVRFPAFYDLLGIAF